MLPKSHRIPSITIRTIMRQGTRTNADTVGCVVFRQRDERSWRSATVVSVSVDKRAVARNRMKRLVSESIRRLDPELPLGTDVIFIVKKGFLHETQAQADKQIYALLQKAGLLRT